MRRFAVIAAVVSAALVASTLTPVAAAAAPKPPYETQTQSYVVPTKHGDIYVEIDHPIAQSKIVKGPAVLTMSPYSILGRNGDSSEWVPQGYHRVWADVVGTGNSGGCFDYGGIREKDTAYAVVEWIAKQKWSNGKVGMIGGSYNGTTANAAAVMKPPHLTTIVPQAAIGKWYGYAFSGGIRFFLNNENPADEGVDTPVAFDFGLALPPPIDGGDKWAERVQDNIVPCDELSHMEHGYDDTPDYDKFWLERDYTKDAGKVEIPALVVHNWGDWNVKQEEGWEFFHALDNSKHASMCFGERYQGHGTVATCDKIAHQWMDHYLMGKDNGADKLPRYISQTADFDAAGKWFKSDNFKTKPVTLYAQETPRTNAADYQWKLLPTKPLAGLRPSTASFPAAGANTESHSNHHARNNHDWFWFESPALKEDTRIFGEIKVQMNLTSQREWFTLTPVIVDVKPTCHEMVGGQHVAQPQCSPRNLYSVTRGWLDSRYRDGLDKQKLLKPGNPVSITVVENPQDYTFKKGHWIGLNFSTEINEWSLPKPYPCVMAVDPAACVNVQVNWLEGKTKVTLPVVGAPKDPMDLFDFGHHH